MKLPLLQVLELSGNFFDGQIPDFDGQSELYFISLSGNKLEGPIPKSIGGLSGLLFFDVRDNNLQVSRHTEWMEFFGSISSWYLTFDFTYLGSNSSRNGGDSWVGYSVCFKQPVDRIHSIILWKSREASGS